MNRFQPFLSGGGKSSTSDPYIRPEIDILEISVERGFADSWAVDPTVDETNDIDPYNPS